MTEPRYAVISTMKDEGPYILEWVAHYRAIGFTDLVVCWNDCSDGTDLILRRLEELGHLRQHRTRVRAGGIQRSALRQAKDYDEVRRADWVFVCDADEFLNIHEGDGSVGALIESSRISESGQPADVIAVPWRRFGNNGIHGFEDRPVTAQFTRAEASNGRRWWKGAYVKSLFHTPQNLFRVGIHCPVPRPDLGRDFVKVMPGGIEIPPETRHMKAHKPGYRGAQVNHYALRSVESFLLKKARGQVNRDGAPHDGTYWRRYDWNDEVDTSIARTDARRADWLERLRADDRLFALHNEAVRFHRRRVEELRALPDFAEIERRLVGQG
jgi:hypothetical protein